MNIVCIERIDVNLKKKIIIIKKTVLVSTNKNFNLKLFIRVFVYLSIRDCKNK